MNTQKIEDIYKYIIQDVLLPNKNVYLINLEEYNQNGIFSVNDIGCQLRVAIESTYDLVNLIKPVFAVTHLIEALNTGTKGYRQLNEYELAFVTEVHSIEQTLIQGGWLLKENYLDIEGMLKENVGGRVEEFRTKQVDMPAITNSLSFGNTLHVSSRKASSIVLYDTYNGKKLPLGIGFAVIDETGEESFVIFSFHTFSGLFNFLSSMIYIVSPLDINAHYAEIAVAQELLRVNKFLQNVGVIKCN